MINKKSTTSTTTLSSSSKSTHTTSSTTTLSSSSSSSYSKSNIHSGNGVPMNFYKKSTALSNVSPHTVDEFWKNHNIKVEDPFTTSSESMEQLWTPIMEFKYIDTNYNKDIQSVLSNFKQPSPIQAQSWPIILSGRDMVGIAATGSGKTLAFLLPSLVHIQAQAPLSNQNGKKGPIVLVLSPTRELALQTAAVATTAGEACNIRSTCIFGGVSKYSQIEALNNKNGGCHIVVATPGRLLDLVEDGSLSLNRVTYFVLDEADRMLDMGFEKDIRSIVAKLPPAGNGTRQTVMFSATWPPAIQNIANEYFHEPVKVTIGSAELAASSTVTQLVDVMEPHVRDSALLKLLQEYHGSKGRKNRIIIFVLYKKEAARMETQLQSRGWNCVAIHGDMSQDARTRAFHAFRDGKIPLLVATDVAARGLDIPQVEYVINYSFPLTIEDYVHRIGRTGRAGATGISHTFFTINDKAHAGELVNVLRDKNQKVPEELLKFGTHVKKKEHALYGAHFKADGGVPMGAPKKMTFDD